MLSKKIQSALNNQIAEEAFASNYYLAMASWCDKEGLHGSSQFLYSQSSQESQHKMKLFRYINDCGGHAIAPAVKQPPQEFKNLSNVFELTLKHEQGVTKLINSLVEACLAEKDYSTFNFLQWYVAEQHEEERLLMQILDLIRITGIDGRGLFHVDKEVGGRFLAESAKKE